MPILIVLVSLCMDENNWNIDYICSNALGNRRSKDTVYEQILQHLLMIQDVHDVSQGDLKVAIKRNQE